MSNSVATTTKTAISFFSPSRTPVFTIAVAGSVAVLSTIDQPAVTFAVPLLAILAATIPLAFRQSGVAVPSTVLGEADQAVVRRAQQSADRQETANLARALGMAGPLLALVFAIWTYDHEQLTVYFVLPYFVCLTQLAIFAVLLLKGRSSALSGHSQVQLALLASCFLIAAVFATNLAASKTPAELASSSTHNAWAMYHVDAVMIGFYLLWASCMTSWGLELRRNWRSASAER